MMRVLTRLMPRSLGGQMALLLGLALFVAQLANFALILNERQKLTLAQTQGPAITRFAATAADLAQTAPEFRAALIADASHREARFALAPDSGIAEADRDPAVEEHTRSALAEIGQQPTAIRASTAAPPPNATRDRGGERAGSQRGGSGRPDLQFLRLAIPQPGGGWLTARIVTPKRDPWLAVRLGAATLLLYLIVLGVTVWIAMRLARPLRRLTRAAEAFGGRTVPVPVVASGPTDLRRAIHAFNAMNLRVTALLDEKDRMLGAIGHDLRTPLASLRIRVESIEPDEEREAAVAKIGEMTAMLEDILVLARTGRAREEARPIDLAALAEVVTDDFREQGHDVRFIDSPRCVVSVQPNLIRRALRNLIDNAIFYAGSAEVSVASANGRIELRVIDRGPGIPADQLQSVLKPFYRLEGSRNRATGGSGLGLAIAQSIAEGHGGTLELGANEPQGLSATIVLPAAA